MKTVYVVHGQHPIVPGEAISVHATADSAAKAAVELVQIICNDTRGMTATVTVDNWEAMLELAQDINGEQYCNVTVTDYEIQGS